MARAAYHCCAAGPPDSGSPNLNYAHVYVDQVSVDGGTLNLSNDDQPDYIDNVTVRNSSGAGIQLGGGNWGNDYFLGPNVVLEQNQYPLALGDGDLLPGSHVPPTGNVHNYIVAPVNWDRRGPFTWSDAGIPYVIAGAGLAQGDGGWRLLPGVTVQFEPGAGIVGDMQARGLPGKPVTLERFDPTQAWDSLRKPGRLEHVVVDGSQYGLIYSGTGPASYIDGAVLSHNARAVVGAAIVRDTQFLNNGVGTNVGFPTDLNGQTNPNSFVGNGTGVETASDARYNWWGDPKGPTSPDNPRGRGDSAAAGVPIKPFLTAAPDYSNSAPIATLHAPFFLVEPGQKIMLTWDAQDDGSIVSQRVLFSPAGGSPGDYTVVADNLSATQRAFEWTVPATGFQVTNMRASIRIEAVDNSGKVGWDAADLMIPSGEATGTITITSDLRGPFQSGDQIDLCWTATGLSLAATSFDAFLFLDGDQRIVPLGGLAAPGCLSLGLTMPFASTDVARVGIRLYGTSNNVQWVFSNYFTVRPDPRVGDAPPRSPCSAPPGA
ncbi:MAG: hypothetical protein M5U01_14320 [Ardenticatenaceae bacterium]|nr:hypothetical protein [Ardenticatenaceae bacterium]